MSKKTLFIIMLLFAMPALSKSAYFKASLYMIVPIELSIIQNLSFESAFSGKNSTVVTEANSTRAAIFKASGEPNMGFVACIRENEIEMRLNGVGSSNKEIITVSNFSFGGDLNRYGIGYFSQNGQLSNLRVGASANIKQKNLPGTYIGSATLSLIYL